MADDRILPPEALAELLRSVQATQSAWAQLAQQALSPTRLVEPALAIMRQASGIDAVLASLAGQWRGLFGDLTIQAKLAQQVLAPVQALTSQYALRLDAILAGLRSSLAELVGPGSLLDLSWRAEGGDYQAALALAERLRVEPFGRGVRQAMRLIPAGDRDQVCRHLAAVGVTAALARVREPQRCKVWHEGRWELIAGDVRPDELPLPYFWSWLRWRAGLIAGDQLVEHVHGEPLWRAQAQAKRLVPLDSIPEPATPGVEDVVTLDLLREELLAVIDAVGSPRERELVELILDGHDLPSAATMLGIGYETAREHLKRRLKVKLTQHGIGPDLI